LSELHSSGTDVREQWRHRIAMVLAERAAIPSGKRLTDDEMRDLMQKLTALNLYKHTPDGKTVLWLLNDKELQSKFL